MTGRTRKEGTPPFGWRAPFERGVNFCGMTHIGRQRNSNEDQFLIAELVRKLELRGASGRPASDPTPGAIPWTVTQGQLLVVADGLGGHAGGGIASGVVVETVAQYMLAALPWLGDDGTARGAVREALARAVRSCQHQLQLAEGPARMGTTLTLAYVSWPRLFVAHVGDSRCYLYRQGGLEQLTRDHTLAQRLIDDQKVPAEEVSQSPLKDVLWNAVGGGNSELLPELRDIELMKGDSLLLCTDGLTKHVSDRILTAVLADDTNASPACERLVEAANEAGGTDNITVIVARY